jgi:magnesium-transporting ATPase (P-type)
MTSPIYSLRVPEVYTSLDSSPEGITADEARDRLSLYGPNILLEQPKPSILSKFSIHTLHPTALLLWGAGLLALLAGEYSLALIVWAIILINAAFSFWQEHRAEEALEALKRLLPDFTRVMRAEEELLVPASEIVPGDVLVLAEGDHIPADARVVESYGLRTNDANLTGEAIPARKYADASLREDIVELERPNLVFAGTSVVSGTGKAIVYSTGMITQFGRIAHLTQTVSEGLSPLQGEIRRIVRRLSWVAFAVGALIFAVGWTAIGLPILDTFLLALGVLVAAIPEGLPATVTITLAMAAQRLARRGVLVKKLSKIETLGNISIICTDKSGTLTQNQMTVREIWVGGQLLRVSGVGYDPHGDFSPNPDHSAFEKDLKALLSAGTLCNNARLTPPSHENPRWSVLGDQTEAALKVAAYKYGLSEDQLEADYPRIHELPFDAGRKRMSTIHKPGLGGFNEVFPMPALQAADRNIDTNMEIALVKGAPREVIQLCTHISLGGDVQKLEDGLREQVLVANDGFARNALRVLAIAYRVLPPRSGSYMANKVENDLVFLGLMAMLDPPRPEVTQAVQACRKAGIRMVMITGDYGLTAESMARRIGMLESGQARIVTGAELEAMREDELLALTHEEAVYARMAPEHKLKLVAAFQEGGEVVAVTGDGVNDAPALRKADVGVVMGLVGTDVAKEAADVIITNDNFYSIVAAVEEGRAIYDNLRKFITYILSSNVPEVLPFIFAGLFDIPPALTVLHVLAIDLGTDLLPGLALGAEKPEPDVLLRKPRRRESPVIDRPLLRRAFLWLGLIEALLSFAGFFAVYVISGSLSLENILSFNPVVIVGDMLDAQAWVQPLAIMVYFSGVLIAQVGNVFTCRLEQRRERYTGWPSNPFLWTGVAIEIILFLALALYNMRSPHPLGIPLWVGLAFYAPVLYGLDWLRKTWVGKGKLS